METEALFEIGAISDFVALVLENRSAAEHILAPSKAFNDIGLLAKAQHCVRAAHVREAARIATEEALR